MLLFIYQKVKEMLYLFPSITNAIARLNIVF